MALDGRGTTNVELRPDRGEREFPALVAIWRSAIDATHDFVAPEYLAQIEVDLPAIYLHSVQLTVAEIEGLPVGFSGVAEGRLEMLFVDDEFRGRGVGSALLDHAVQQLGVTALDVNEQNPQAIAFYSRKGFEVIGRSELDSSGQPYPLLHMQRSDRGS